ncbi:lanthionine synthetase LanC family protein [Pedobacter sp. UYP1]|uniref:lanthionine synthetase LanC family protein n=1 Tax=Pedobacter sp. UYP1 TaxID=1756396 RepID=UPI0033978444
MKISVEMQSQILELANKYASYLVKTSGKEKGMLNWTIPSHNNTNVLNWGAPENIDSGVSGIILFLIELYQQSGDKFYLDLVDDAIDNLLTYCKRNPSNNFSLYTGRGGVIYVLIQRYSIDKKGELIKDALSLIAEANKGYLNSVYTTDYLYDGRAGTLLLLLELYQLSKADFLLEYINEFIVKIISGANISSNGISWRNKEEVNLKDSCGFAHGAAGIKFVFEQFCQHPSNQKLSSLINEINRFISSAEIEKSGNWENGRKDIFNQQQLADYIQESLHDNSELLEPQTDSFWADGTIGIMNTIDGLADDKIISINNYLQELGANQVFSNKSLYNGAAGLGMFLLSQQDGIAGREKIIERIIEKLSPESVPVDIDGGLMHGNLGSIYFCLKAAGIQKEAAHLLNPVLINYPAIDLNTDISLCKINLLIKYYPRTIQRIRNLNDEVFKAYIEASSDNLSLVLQQFSDFVEHESQNSLPLSIRPYLLDLFKLEKQKTDFYFAEKRSSFQLYIQEKSYHDRIMNHLNKPLSWLLEQVLEISGSVKVLHSKWDWCVHEDSSRPIVYLTDYLDTPSDDFEYLIQTYGKLELAEFFLSKDKQILLYCFSEAKSIEQAIREIRYFIQSLPVSRLEDLTYGISKSRATNDFLNQLDSIILYKIREWIYRGILIMKFSEQVII